MFFSQNILLAKHGNFAIIWQYMHDKKHLKYRNQVLHLDVVAACDDLMKYVPTGVFKTSELKQKMSLYLLGQLSYGITLVHQLQVKHIYDDMHDFMKSLSRVSYLEEEKKKRKRSTIAPKEAEEDEKAILELMKPLAEKEEEEGKKGRRPSKAPILDLKDRTSYVDQYIPRATGEGAIPDEQFDVQETHLLPLEDLLAVAGRITPPLAPGDRRFTDFDVRLASPRFSVNMEKLFESPRARPSTPIDYTADLERIQKELEQQRFSEFTAPEVSEFEPVYRKGPSEESEEFELPTLDAEDLVPPKPKRAKQIRGLIRDEVTSISGEQMKQQLADYSDTFRSKEKEEKELKKALEPSLTELLKPYPYHKKYLNPKWLSCWEHNLRKDGLHPPPLTFEEAKVMTLDEMYERHFNRDISIWRSESAIEEREEGVEAREKLVDMEPKLEPEISEKISVGAAFESFDMTEMELEQQRRQTGDTLEFERNAMFERPPSQEIEFEPEPVQEVAEDARLSDEVRRMKLQQEEERLSQGKRMDREMENILSKIKEDPEKPIILFTEDVVPLATSTKKQAARAFYAVLQLLKEKQIDVKQKKPYGEIKLRLKRHHE